jgi:hypothetical protein
MEELLAALLTWLATQFGFAAAEAPRVELVDAVRMETLGSSTSGSAAIGDPRPRPGREVAALYDDKTRTIFLPEGWTGETPAERSMLVHELVHHLQNAAGAKFECSAAREKAAYVAQERWLREQGTSLVEALGVDPATLLVRTKCM